jgi:hypothetical protein
LASFTEPAEQVCDNRGGKWMFLSHEYSYFDAVQVCRKFKYRIPNLSESAKVGSEQQLLATRSFWTTGRATPEAQQQFLHSLRLLYPGTDRQYGKLDGEEKASVACYCPSEPGNEPIEQTP